LLPNASRQGNTSAPKTPTYTHKARKRCVECRDAQQKLLPTAGQSWQHRAFFAHGRPAWSFASLPGSPASAILLRQRDSFLHP
jgi:hypothetical protein